MKLEQVLTMVAAHIKADAQALIAFAAEDTLGGYDVDESKRKFPQGSLWEPEGKMLYALVRWLKPDVVAEIGGWAGASASHLALAVQANGGGKVISVDSGEGGQVAGHLIPAELKPYVTLVRADGRDWLREQDNHSIGLLFEDADHSTQLTADISKLALEKVMPGGYYLNHDAAHDYALVGGGMKISSPVGREVRDGLDIAKVYFRTYLAEPSDCGLSLSVMSGVPKTARVDTLSINGRDTVLEVAQRQFDKLQARHEVKEEDASPVVDYGIAPIETPKPKRTRK